MKSDAESPILASVREAAAGLHRAGLIDKSAMCAFDTLCSKPGEPSGPDGPEAVASASVKRRSKPHG